MSPIRFDHVGITVADLESVTGFFVGLGFELEGQTVLEGEFLDTVVGLRDSRTEMVPAAAARRRNRARTGELHPPAP